MAIRLIVTYSKKLGLPGFSSHQFSVTVETELTNMSELPAQSDQLYQLLQSNVDEQIQKPGFIPPPTYGMEPANGPATSAPNGQAPTGNQVNGNHTSRNHTNGSHVNGSACVLDGRWRCSDKQRDLILKIVDEHQLDKRSIEELAIARFGHGVRLLNKLEASGLIDELLAVNGNSGPSNRPNGSNRANGNAYNYQRRKDVAA
jgi:hypothetical protein